MTWTSPKVSLGVNEFTFDSNFHPTRSQICKGGTLFLICLIAMVSINNYLPQLWDFKIFTIALSDSSYYSSITSSLNKAVFFSCTSYPGKDCVLLFFLCYCGGHSREIVQICRCIIVLHVLNDSSVIFSGRFVLFFNQIIGCFSSSELMLKLSCFTVIFSVPSAV